MTLAQRSAEWRQARAGVLTASRFGDVIAVRRDGKPTAERARYMREIVFERAAGAPKREVSSKALAWGTEVEDFARQAYELHTGHFVEPGGFVLHPEHPSSAPAPTAWLAPTEASK